MRTMAFAAFAVSLMALAGCSSPDLQGTVERDATHQQAAAGSATIVYQPFVGQNAAGGLPSPLNGTLQCAQGQAPGQVPVDRCKGPYTDVKANFTGLPEPGTLAYSFRLAGVDQEIGTDADGGDATFAKNVSADLSGKVTGLELYLGDYLLMTAPAAGGKFEFTPTVTGVTVQGTFVGSTVELTVFGLPPSNETYQGRLYLPGATDSTERFTVTNGKNTYTTTQHPVAEYGEFHIHLGDSRLNLYKAAIHVQDE